MVSVSRPRLPAAFRAVNRIELRVFGKRRFPHHLYLKVERQDYGQVFIGHRHHPARIAIDDGDRRAPVALPRYAPVPQAVVHLPFADTFLFEVVDDGRDCLPVLPSVESGRS